MVDLKIISCHQEKFCTFAKILAVLTAFALPLSTTAVDILFPLTILFGFLSEEYRANFVVVFKNPVAVILLVFFALFVVGLAYTTAPMHDALRVLVKYDKLLFGALLFPFFLEEKWRARAVSVFIVAIFFMLAASYLKAFGWITYGHWDGHVEFFRGHIAFNFFLAFTAYLLLLKITEFKSYWWLWIIPLLLIIYDIFFMSIGRSGYFIFVLLAFVFFVQKMKWRGILIALLSCVLVLGTAAIFSPIFKGRIHDIVSDVSGYRADNEAANSNTSLGLRITFSKNSLNLIKAHPIFGTGTGSFKSDYANIKPAPIALIGNPHDEYLHITVQFGIVGFIILMLMFSMQFWYSKYLPRPYNFIAQAVEISIIVGCFGNSWILDAAEGHLYMYFIALTFAALPLKNIPVLVCSREK